MVRFVGIGETINNQSIKENLNKWKFFNAFSVIKFAFKNKYQEISPKIIFRDLDHSKYRG